jgi:dienelactone hydrolase
MKERSAQFGPHGRLSGILTEPSSARRSSVCVLVSAGLVPKFGPYRIYAQLARRLARDGFSTLRFDLGGIGDSQAEFGQLPLRVRTGLEIRAAIDHLLADGGYGGVVLGGLCSGAEDSFRYAESDPRVTGVVLIDPFSYRTSGWRWRHWAHQIMRRSLRALGLYRPIARSTVAAPTGAAPGKSLLSYKYMDHGESERILRRLIDRGVYIHFVYTGGMRESFNHEGQLQEMFGSVDFKGRVRLDYLPRSEHTQALEEDRDALIEAIGRRLSEGIDAKR